MATEMRGGGGSASSAKCLNRRELIAAAGMAFLCGLRPGSAEALQRSAATFASAYRDPKGGFGIAVLDERGRILWRHKMEQRGHGLTSHRPTGQLVMFARRPGLFALAFSNAAAKSKPVLIASQSGRHFYGHGAFAPDGKVLYATENDYENACGVIGLYDVENDYARLGEWASGGIGPHELVLTEDGGHLVVANGGIETHPDFGRAKLNLGTMSPSLAVIDTGNGRVIERHSLSSAEHQMSLRHLAASADGRIWFGGQWQGQNGEWPNQGPEQGPDQGPGNAGLLGSLKLGEGLLPLSADPAALAGLKSYVGSVALSADGRIGAASSPRGGEAVFWHTSTGNIIGKKTMADVCGIAAGASGGIALSAGSGDFILKTGAAPAHRDMLWDNHLLAL